MKWLSSPAMPARCRCCGGLSYVAASRSTDILLAATIWLIASGLGAALLNSVWPLIAGVLTGFLAYARHWQQAGLTATDQETSDKTQRRHALLNAITLVLSCLWS
ncbi:MAG: hypothetical protein JNJ95_08890 [Dechloromonas sp.]|nr:hypothetical protein [Dechloromonas sp.]